MSSPDPPPDNDEPTAAEDGSGTDAGAPLSPPPPPPPPGAWAAPRTDQTWPADDPWAPPPPEHAWTPEPTPAASDDDQRWAPEPTADQWAPEPTTDDDQRWAPEPTADQWAPPTEAPAAEPWAAPSGSPADEPWAAPSGPAAAEPWAPPTGPTAAEPWAPPTEAPAAEPWAPPTGPAADEPWAPPPPAGQPAADEPWASPEAPAGYPPAEGQETWPPPPQPAAVDDQGWSGEPGAHPPPAEPWTPAGFQPEWTIEPAPAAPGGADVAETWPPEPDAPRDQDGALAAWPDPHPADSAMPGTDESVDRARGPRASAELWPPVPVAEPGDGARIPPSPAYSTPVSAAYASDDQGPDTTPAPPPLVPPPGPPPRRGRRALVAAAVLVVAALVAGMAARQLGGGGDDGSGGSYTFGKVGTTADGAVVRPAAGQKSRSLEDGETVHAGWVVRTSGDAAVTVDLIGDGVVRFDRGATLTFIDLAVDPETGKRSGESRPAIQIDGGRVWVNPGGRDAVHAIRLRLAAGEIVSRHNPVGVDCTVSCRVEAPDGGVTLTTTGGTKATPGAGEAVDVEDPQNLDLLTSEEPSGWARQNLKADRAAHVAVAVKDEAPSVKGSALADGRYRISVSVTGPSTGDPIPDDLKHRPGERRAATVVADGSGCVTLPCDLTLRGNNHAKGTARVADGTVTVDLTQPIDCKAPDGRLLVAGIGTTTLKVELNVLDARAEGTRWVASSLEGKGTLASTLSTPCAAGEILGTSTAPVAVSATTG